MKRWLAILATAPVTLAGFGVLAAALLAVEVLPAGDGVVAIPLAVVAVNLCCALATRQRLRRGGLGVFHVALLALMIVAAAGRLMRFEGHVEVAEGADFDARAVETTFRGPLHQVDLPDAVFVQGPLRVEYRPGVRRAHTTSVVRVREADGVVRTRLVGDDVPLLVRGYRFYTTHNKGFAPVVTWTSHRGAAQSGALHLPSYPRFEGQQHVRWQPPGAAELRLFLNVGGLIDEHGAWILEPRDTRAELVVHGSGVRAELRPGESLALVEGTLRYERLAGWMGYRIYSDPTLPALVALALVAILGLAWHLWHRPLAARLPFAAPVSEEA